MVVWRTPSGRFTRRTADAGITLPSRLFLFVWSVGIADGGGGDDDPRDATRGNYQRPAHAQYWPASPAGGCSK